MASYADHLFPSTDATYSPSLALEYSNFTYWRDILPTITDNNDNSGSDQTDGKINYTSFTGKGRFKWNPGDVSRKQI